MQANRLRSCRPNDFGRVGESTCSRPNDNSVLALFLKLQVKYDLHKLAENLGKNSTKTSRFLRADSNYHTKISN